VREVELDGHPGLLHRPRSARALFVFAHGAGAGMHHAFMADVAEALARHAIATLRWEFLYMANGKPRPDPARIAEASVAAVWRSARKRYAKLPMFAGGKSFGGRMTSRAHAATPLEGLRGLIFLGFPLHPPDKPGIERAEHLAHAAGPMLFLQGTRDDLADLALLRPVVADLGTRATLHVIDGADHGFDVLVRSGTTRERVIDELAATIAAWIARTLDT
jgi:predicted alpha/beta-hydrolase family hydrolase